MISKGGFANADTVERIHAIEWCTCSRIAEGRYLMIVNGSVTDCEYPPGLVAISTAA